MDNEIQHLQKIADQVSSTPYKCTECNKEFGRKSNLLRHQRTLHSNRQYSCKKCQHTFNREDNLNQHIKICTQNVEEGPLHDLTSQLNLSIGGNTNHSRKRTADNQVDEPKPKVTKLSNSGVCNWCGHQKELLPGKQFCQNCSEKGRECKWCHRPLPDRFYGKRNDVCDSCVRRRENYIQKGGNASKTALDGTVKTTVLEPNPGNLWDLLLFFVDNQDNIADKLLNALEKHKGIKWFLTLYVKFIKYNEQNETMYAEPTFRSQNMTLTNGANIDEEIAAVLRKLNNDFQNFERDGSGWSIDKIIKLEVNTVEYVPLTGSSYVPLPQKIMSKKAVLNIINDDQKCFIWCILAALHPVESKSANRITNYVDFESSLDVSNIQMPMTLGDIPKFEKQNQLSVNVFGLEKEDVYPLYITDARYDKHVSLLLISNGEKRHYCLIKSMSRLLGDRTKHNGQAYYCNYCLHAFSKEDIFLNHVDDCKRRGPQKVTFPQKEEDKWIRFKSINKQLKVPFIIYADFECLTRPVSTNDSESTTTTRYQKHDPSGFCYVVKCTNDDLSMPAKTYRGPNTIDTFFDCLLQEEKKISEILDHVVPMQLTPTEEAAFQKSVKCHICLQDLGADRVRDHDHLTGVYRGAAHSECNLQLQFRKAKTSSSAYSRYFIPIVFHNLSGYDLHLMMSSVGKLKDRKISCIPHNMENYLSFTLDNLRFIDSHHFMNASLSTLVDNLSEMGADMFPTLQSHFEDEKEMQLLLRKGVYPYDYMDDESKFNETNLPSPSAFYNKLTDSEITKEDYQHAENVWKTFDMKTLGDYHDLYMKTDVLLLCDVFENFRNVCFQHYQLDAAHYFTTPGLAWDSMLKMTGANLELLDDIDMVNMIQKGIRGGVAMITQKYANANNPQVPNYDHSKPTSWISYLDMNNLYGTAMVDSLPEKDFEWLNEDQITSLDVTNVRDDSNTGYILEVDLEYPSHLHDEHNDYPLAPETKTVSDEMLSPHTRELKRKLKIKGKSHPKLVPNLCDKTNYVLHYRNLKLYLRYGMRLKKVHRVLQFTQSAWLKPYIDFNTEMRKRYANDFEKDFFKLMNNSIFGKTMENIFNRINVELVNTAKRMRKVSAKPNFHSFTIFNDFLVGANLKKTNLIFNKPVYVGFSILDISKTFMYQFHYDYMKAKYGEKANLLFTDTDSLTYLVETEDLYADMLENLHLFDTSNYPKNHHLYSSQNAKVLGRMKDETASQPIQEFVGLRSKMYALKVEVVEKNKQGQTKTYIKDKKTAKGVSRAVIDKQLKHDTYKECLFEQTSMKHDMNFIRSRRHELYSITVNKTSLSPYDDKRYVMGNGIHTLAHGHYKIFNN